MSLALINGILGALNISKIIECNEIMIDQNCSETDSWKNITYPVSTMFISQKKKKDEYIKRMVKNAMKEATPEFSNHYGEILNELQEIKEFESDSDGQ